MPEVITVGETMAVVVPKEMGKLSYVSEFEMKAAGAESNMAVGVCKLGHTAGWVSSLGDDALGRKVLHSIRAEGVETEYVEISREYRTGLMIKEILPGRETRVYYYRDGSAASHMSVSGMPGDYLKSCKILHLTGILPMLGSTCMELTEWLFELAADNKILLSFDPNIRKKLWREEAHGDVLRKCMLNAGVVFTGREEAKLLLGTDDREEICDILFTKGSAEYVAVKDGDRGAFVADRRERCDIPAYPCEALDTVGAGDAFNAAFLCGILEHRPLETCGRMGAVAGAYVVQSRGDIEGLPEREELECYMNGQKEICR